jgi:hypothetical protein
MNSLALTHQLVGMALALADRSVVCDVESEGNLVVMPDGSRWWDIRPMFNPHEHCNEVIDMARQAVSYGLARGVLFGHPLHEHLVHIARPDTRALPPSSTL